MTYTSFKIDQLLKYLIVLAVVAGYWGVGVTAEAATLRLSPNTGVYTAGQTFTTRIVVNTAGSAINAAEASLSFDPAQLSVVSVTKGSTFSLWAVEPSFSNSAGTINFGGGSPAGYTGSNGTVLNITWRSKGAGTARVSFTNGSVLAADGRGTNVVQSLGSGSYTIAAADVVPEPEVIEYIAPANTPGTPVISSETHQSDGWSQDTSATLAWTLPSGVTAVRTLLDEASGSIPTRVYEPGITSITLDELEEGIQYFHLQFKNEEGWGRVAHYRLAVDTTAPEDVQIALAEGSDTVSPNQTLLVSVATGSAPITEYKVQLDGGEPVTYEANASGTIALSDITPGYHTVIAEVIDAAGNSTIATLSFTIDAFSAPQFTEYPTQFGESVVPVFSGATRPGAIVAVTITPVGGQTEGTTYTVTADAEGVFSVIPDGRFVAGVYEMTAVATDQYGAQSEPSEVVRMVVDRPGYIKLGTWLVSVLSVIVPLAALVAVLILLILWFMVRARRVRTYVVTETDEALTVLVEQFAALKATVAAEEKALAKSRKTKKLTKAETTLIENITTHITTTEAAIKKEVSDVDDVVR